MYNISVSLIEPGAFNTNVTNREAGERNYKKGWAEAPSDIKEEYGNNFPDECRLQE